MIKHNHLEKKVTISIVSHGHCKMLEILLRNINNINNLNNSIGHIIITHNIQSDLIVNKSSFSFNITIIKNESPLGFGENHNQAFKYCSNEYFCVLNPDVQFVDDPFSELINCLNNKGVGIAAPIVRNLEGKVEDSFRKFPTPLLIFKKFLFGKKGIYSSSNQSSYLYPDWIAGMFMLLKSSTYKNLGGFDEKYFLYYEDIDFCLRSWKANNSVIVSKKVSIVHDARRESHTSFQFFFLHLKSMFRFFLKNWLRFPR